MRFLVCAFLLSCLYLNLVAGLGEIVAFCPLVKRSPDDPLINPGQPGKSHLHDFFGASRVDAFTTPAQMRSSATSCSPSFDHSAYWIPSLIKNGKYQTPERVTIYYHAFDNFAAVQTMPLGLSIIARKYKWSCNSGGGNYNVPSFPIPDCGGNQLTLLVDFPQCWNGKDLTSPNFETHMAYATANRCPASHPTLLPRLQYKIHYAPGAGGAGSSLSSGSPTTAHGDFVNGWDPAALLLRVQQCLRRNAKCQPTLPGDANISPTFPNSQLPPIFLNDTAIPVDPSDDTDVVENVRMAHSDAFVIVPQVDSYVRDGDFASDNYGDMDHMVISSGNSTGATQEAFMTFDMTSAPADMKNCFLELTIEETMSSPYSFDLKLETVSESWAEDAITFDNRPSSQSFKEFTRGAKQKTVQVDILDFCKATMNKADKTVSFRLRTSDKTVDPLIVNSRESGYNASPKIVITSAMSILKPAFILVLFFVSFLLL